MIDSYFDSLKYKEFIELNKSGQPQYKPERIVKGLRLSGRLKIVHTESGDYTESSVIYKTVEKLKAQSLLEGREIMECVHVPGLGYNCGYMSYLK